MSSALQVHHLEPSSKVNGPGQRAVVWLQGCTLACPGCFNPLTHPARGGASYAVDAVYQWVQSLPPETTGLTFSGGEPLQQLRPLIQLLQQVRASTSLSVILFTGYTWEEVQKMPQASALINLIDVCIAGRYQEASRLAHHLAGSANKTFHFLTSRYSPADFEQVEQAEIILAPDGEIRISGINPPTL